MLWDEPKIFFLERRYFFSIILSEFLKNRVALQNVLPSAILIECKEEKVPVSMVNAFVNPVKPNEKNGYDLVRGSILRLAEQVESVQNCYGLMVDKRLWFCQDIYDIQPQCDTVVCASLPELLEQVADTLQ